MMLPMSIRCTVCGEYIGRGKKFNSRKEVVQGESYLGLKVFRFYIRCTKCASELTFKTDPKNSTYVSEQNCIRNYTPWSNTSQDDLELEEDERRRLGILSGDDDGDDKKRNMGGGDAMQMLENKTMEMRQEMDLLDDLDELKTISAQNRRISVDELRERWFKMNREKGGHNSKQEQNLVKNNENESGENGEDLMMLKRGEPRLTDEEERELREFEQDLFTQQDNDNDYDENGEEVEENDDGNVIGGTVQHETIVESDPILASTGASSSSSSSSFLIGFKKRKQEQEQEKEENGKRQKLENGSEVKTRAQSAADDNNASSTLTNDHNGATDKSVSNDASISNNSLFNGVDISVVKPVQQTNGKKKRNGGAKKSKKNKSSALSSLCQYGDDD